MPIPPCLRKCGEQLRARGSVPLASAGVGRLHVVGGGGARGGDRRWQRRRLPLLVLLGVGDGRQRLHVRGGCSVAGGATQEGGECRRRRGGSCMPCRRLLRSRLLRLRRRLRRGHRRSGWIAAWGVLGCWRQHVGRQGGEHSRRRARRERGECSPGWGEELERRLLLRRRLLRRCSRGIMVSLCCALRQLAVVHRSRRRVGALLLLSWGGWKPTVCTCGARRRGGRFVPFFLRLVAVGLPESVESMRRHGRRRIELHSTSLRHVVGAVGHEKVLELSFFGGKGCFSCYNWVTE